MPSLSQQYRPKTFAEITGQAHVTETLRKEVATGKLGHAYLFSGPRGVGKTTAARVFAKALNCEQPKDGEPCNACAACEAANVGTLIDLIEMDAATNTQVEKIREAIIEHVRFGPAFAKRKIYILDEAHMLSASSWNALLKTLEEPPAYAFFIFATTEWHKVPATIVSRCQRFEFHRIAEPILVERVMDLAKREGWKIEPEVAKLIASRSDGCVRDAETLLGQLGALGSEKIDLDIAHLIIPPSRIPTAAGLMKFWMNRDHAGSLRETERLSEEGVAFLPLFDDLLVIVRKLLGASADEGTVKRWSQGTEEEQAMVPLIGGFTPLELNHIALLLLERRRDVKGGVDPLFALMLVNTAVVYRDGKKDHEQKDPLMDRPVSSTKKIPASTQTPVSSRTSEQRMDERVIERKVVPMDPALQEEEASLNQAPMETLSQVSERAPASSTVLDIDAIRMKWNVFIRAVDEKNHSLPFILKISRPEEVRGTTLVIRFQYPFHRDKILSDQKHRTVVEVCARDVFECAELTLDGIIGEDPAASTKRSQDMVSNILKAFGGSVVEA